MYDIYIFENDNIYEISCVCFYVIVHIYIDTLNFLLKLPSPRVRGMLVCVSALDINAHHIVSH